MKIVLSSSHSKFLTGAVDLITERDESRRVVARVAEYLRAVGVDLIVIHDDVSKGKTANINWLVAAHNKVGKRDLDCSIHFNSIDGGTTARALGTEVWYRTQKALAIRISAAIAKASGLIDRGDKYGNWTILTDTTAPAVLVEVCFVNSKADVAIYQAPGKFEAICKAIAESITGKSIETSSSVGSASPTPVPPTLRRGSSGEAVAELQRLLNIGGEFGEKTEEAVRAFQAANVDTNGNKLVVDGIVGQATYGALGRR